MCKLSAIYWSVSSFAYFPEIRGGNIFELFVNLKWNELLSARLYCPLFDLYVLQVSVFEHFDRSVRNYRRKSIHHLCQLISVKDNNGLRGLCRDALSEWPLITSRKETGYNHWRHWNRRSRHFYELRQKTSAVAMAAHIFIDGGRLVRKLLAFWPD